MSNILTFDQFKEGYVFEKKTLYRENIESLNYLDSRFDLDQINENWISDAWEGASEWVSSLFDGNWNKITLEDVLHFSADLGGIFGDLVAPGLGSTIDIAHAMAYFFQASQKKEPEQMEYFINGFLTLIFAHPAMNIFQGIFATIKTRFWKLISWVLSFVKKEGTEIAKKGAQELLDEYAKKPGAFEWQISKKISDDVDGVEKWIKAQIDKYGGKPTPKSSKFKEWANNIVSTCLWPFRWLRDNVFSPLVSRIKGYRAGRALVIGVKGVRFLAKESVFALLKLASKFLPNLPKAKKIKMFDSIAEVLSKAQREKGILRGKVWDGSADKFVIDNANLIIYNFEKGADRCKVIVGGSLNDEGSELFLKRKEFFEKEFLERFERGEVKLPETSTTRTTSTLIDPSTGRPFEREITTSVEELKEKTMQEYSTHMARSTQIMEIDKSHLLAKQYESVEGMIRRNVNWKVFGGAYKFYTSCFAKREGEEEVSSEESGSEMVLDQEQLQEQERQMEAGEWDPGTDDYDNVYDELTEEEQEQVAEPLDAENLQLEKQQMGPNNIFEATWLALETIYSQVDLPKNPESSSPSYWIQKFQSDNSLEPNGELDRQTLSLLIEKCSDQKVKIYLQAYIETLPDMEEKSTKGSRDKKSKDSKPQTQKEEGEESKGGSKVKRRLKKFGRFLSGEE